MTQVEFAFKHPDGDPLVNTPFTIRLQRSGFVFEEDGIVVPETLTEVTGLDGTVIVELQPSSTPYLLVMAEIDVADDDDLARFVRYKFYVPVSDTIVRAQDLMLTPVPNSEPWDEVALQMLTDAKVAAMAAAARAKVSEDNAKTSEVNSLVSAEASAASQNAALVSQQAAAVSETNAAQSAAGALASEGTASEALTAIQTIEADIDVDLAAVIAARDAAQTSATVAAASEGVAVTKAGEASTSAAAALLSEQNADLSEADAEQAKVDAQIARDAAAAFAANAEVTGTEVNADRIAAEQAALDAEAAATQAPIDAAAAASEVLANLSLTNIQYPFTFVAGQAQYDVGVISGDPTVTTAGLALWVESGIEYAFTINDAKKFTLDADLIAALANGAAMRIIVNARFDDLIANFDDLQDVFAAEYAENYQVEKDTRTGDYYTYLQGLQLEPAVPYVDGAELAVLRPTQSYTQSGVLYRPKATSLPISTTNWAADASKFVVAEDMSLRQELGEVNNALIAWSQGGVGAVSMSVRDALRPFVNPEQFGAIGNGIADDTLALQRADDYAKLFGLRVVYPFRKVYRVSSLFVRAPSVDFNFSTIKGGMPGATAAMVNWGTKPDTMVDGFVSNLLIDCSAGTGMAFRMYGNHERPKIRNFCILDCDFYAMAIGGSFSLGDYADIVNGLDIDGVLIASMRGNVSEGTDNSMGLEFFPKPACKNWSLKNIRTYGKIINKIHQVDGLTIDGSCRFEATADFNAFGSALFEINNCDKIQIASGALFKSLGVSLNTLQISGLRVVGGIPVTQASIDCTVYGVLNIVEATGVVLGACNLRSLKMSNNVPLITLNGTNISESLGTGGGLILGRLVATGGFINSIRFEAQSDNVFGDFVVNGAVLGYRIDFRGVGHAHLIGCTLPLKGQLDAGFVVRSQGADCLVDLVRAYMDGANARGRPLLVSNGGKMRVKFGDFSDMTSTNLLASGSSPLTLALQNSVNGVLVP